LSVFKPGGKWPIQDKNTHIRKSKEVTN
jgi:hypothetical protein